MSAPPKTGLYPPVPTFFKSDNWTIDIETQGKHAKFLEDNGIPGLVVNGSTGENSHLTRSERLELIKVVKAAAPSLTIIHGVVQSAVQDAIDEIQQAKDAGADYALVVPPAYFGALEIQTSIASWFTKVADKSALPIMIYLFPGVCNGIVIQPSTFEALSAHPQIVGAKFTYLDASHFVRTGLNPKVASQTFSIFPGFANFLLPAYMTGCGGLIDGMGNAFPKATALLLKYAIEGNHSQEALDLQYKLAMAEQSAVEGGLLATKATIKKYVGLGESAGGRPPLDYSMKEEVLVAKYGDYLDALYEIEKSL